MVDAAGVTTASSSGSSRGEGGQTVNTCELRFRGYDAASQRGAIRWELFLDRQVRDVLLTPSADTLRVLHDGSADPEHWCASLRAAGFPTPHVGASQEVLAADEPRDAVA
jgi:hypothetical protein